MPEKLSEIEVHQNILAAVMHDLSPSVSVEQWQDHIKKTGHDPKLFFGSNGEGYNEYTQFVNTFDRDKYERKIKEEKKQKRQAALRRALA